MERLSLGRCGAAISILAGQKRDSPTMVLVTLASREVPMTVSLQLFLPGSWTCEPERTGRAKVPADR